MIVVKSPLRVSLFGGGSDLPNFYREHGGGVLSTTIDKAVYITVKKRFDDRIQINWREPETVDSVDEIRHELVREALKMTGVKRGIEICTMADVPSRGCGLGSSSSLTVGLLHALSVYVNEPMTQEELADDACHIEIDILQKPIGKQDSYAVAYGGMNHTIFHPDTYRKMAFDDNLIAPNPILASEKRLRDLNDRLLLFYTGSTRSADTILAEQNARTVENTEALLKMKQQALDAANILEGSGRLDVIGEMLHEAWALKRRLASGITTGTIDMLYADARRAGAIGGKLAGAGGSGFFLLYCRPENQQAVRQALSEYRELPFKFDPCGARVIFNCQ